MSTKTSKSTIGKVIDNSFDRSFLLEEYIGDDLIVNGELCTWLDLDDNGNWIITRSDGSLYEIVDDDLIEFADY